MKKIKTIEYLLKLLFYKKIIEKTKRESLENDSLKDFESLRIGFASDWFTGK